MMASIQIDGIGGVKPEDRVIQSRVTAKGKPARDYLIVEFD